MLAGAPAPADLYAVVEQRRPPCSWSPRRPQRTPNSLRTKTRLFTNPLRVCIANRLPIFPASSRKSSAPSLMAFTPPAISLTSADLL